MARYSVIVLLLALSSILLSDSLNVLIEDADSLLPKESNGTGYQVRKRTFNDDSDVNCGPGGGLSQCDASLSFHWHMYWTSPEGSEMKVEARKKIIEAFSHAMHLEYSISLIANLLFGIEKGPVVLKATLPENLPFVDDQDCFYSLIKMVHKHCGSLFCAGNAVQYIANICNAGIKEEQMVQAVAQACAGDLSNPWRSIQMGFSP